MSALGYNTGYIEEIYKQYLEDPKSVSESWQDFFADYKPSESFVAARSARVQEPAEAGTVALSQAMPGGGDGALTDPIPPGIGVSIGA